MRTIILLLLFTLCVNAQSLTEKYNSMLKRYEYFDNSRNMVGYKQYNYMLKQWEYYDVNQQNSRPQRRDTNFDLLVSLMATKQARYDQNKRRVQNAVDEIQWYFNTSTDETAVLASEMFGREYINLYNSKQYDLSSDAKTNEIINWLYGGYKYCMEKCARDLENARVENNPIERFAGNYKIFCVDKLKFAGSELKYETTVSGDIKMIISSDKIEFKVNSSDWGYRDLNFKYYSPNAKCYVYGSRWGDVIISQDFTTVKFIDPDKVTGEPAYMYVYNLVEPKGRISSSK